MARFKKKHIKEQQLLVQRVFQKRMKATCLFESDSTDTAQLDDDSTNTAQLEDDSAETAQPGDDSAQKKRSYYAAYRKSQRAGMSGHTEQAVREKDRKRKLPVSASPQNKKPKPQLPQLPIDDNVCQASVQTV